jgi:hypothetical protein
MPSKKLTLPGEAIDDMIWEIRGVRVILDSDLAAIYGVATKRLNEQFQRNRKRFPQDFVFQLTGDEVTNLRSQITTLKKRDQNVALNWSQFATSSSRRRGKAYRPWAFTEHGALQAANVIRSVRAVQMSIFVIRVFVKMRETLLGTRELAKKLAALEKQLTGRLDSHEAAIVHVLQRVMDVIDPPAPPPRCPSPVSDLSPDVRPSPFELPAAKTLSKNE